MRKIISLFQRNYDGDRLVRDEVVPGAEWVIAGEGVATRKFDGTCCMIRDGKLYKRYDAKKGKTPPPNFEPAQDYDEVTGHMPGWVPVGDGPEDRWFREAFDAGVDSRGIALAAGDYFGVRSYELCGPKVQGNPERFASHVLVPHGGELLSDAPRRFEYFRDYFAARDIEGIVWHHADGRMVKIKAKDFGLKRLPLPRSTPMSETRATEVRDAMNLVARAAEHVAEYVYQDDADSVLLREAIRILRGAVASPGPTESDRRDTERRGIPEMTGCCKNCGERTEIHVVPVNDTIVISITPRCRCTPFVVNPGFNLWPARVPSVGSSNATEEGAERE